MLSLFFKPPLPKVTNYRIKKEKGKDFLKYYRSSEAEKLKLLEGLRGSNSLSPIEEFNKENKLESKKTKCSKVKEIKEPSYILEPLPAGSNTIIKEPYYPNTEPPFHRKEEEDDRNSSTEEFLPVENTVVAKIKSHEPIILCAEKGKTLIVKNKSDTLIPIYICSLVNCSLRIYHLLESFETTTLSGSCIYYISSKDQKLIEITGKDGEATNSFGDALFDCIPLADELCEIDYSDSDRNVRIDNSSGYVVGLYIERGGEYILQQTIPEGIENYHLLPYEPLYMYSKFKSSLKIIAKSDCLNLLNSLYPLYPIKFCNEELKIKPNRDLWVPIAGGYPTTIYIKNNSNISLRIRDRKHNQDLVLSPYSSLSLKHSDIAMNPSFKNSVEVYVVVPYDEWGLQRTIEANIPVFKLRGNGLLRLKSHTEGKGAEILLINTSELFYNGVRHWLNLPR